MREKIHCCASKENMNSNQKVQKLQINHDKTCSCPDNHISCIDRKEWCRCQFAIWEIFYNRKDIRDKNIHPATFPIGLPKRCIELFTHKGELVLDPFVGVGTTLIAARETGRNAVGFDLNDKYIAIVNERLAKMDIPLSEELTQQIAICDNAINIPNYLDENTVALCITSPPYGKALDRKIKNISWRNPQERPDYNKILQYSNDPADLGTMEVEEYTEALKAIFKGILPLFKSKAHCVINAADIWYNGRRCALHNYIINAMHEVGYEIRNIIIWDKRKMIHSFCMFGYPSNFIATSSTYEYILDFVIRGD